ncbi:MAG: phosphate ABC transporter substrate-binding protein [Fusobacterium gastrosuis]|uniref:phosphate ABC transporter substrate-binding protein n=1 Tax=Fusobacterium gastrosuis TaxID=1755100 RepID=UPI002A9D95E0|nr:phosphate ABC transporter substrate-binding protein [Fusobacteriaceae bacterium]MDY5794569.1 phosphate ABC transporter substrate-binding protein [Fusobacterium gastrosuis]
MKKILKNLALLLVFSLSFQQGFAKSNIIQLKGSDTILNLSQALTEQYMKQNKVRISIVGGGSGIGIAALLNKTTDIALASRSIKDKEIKIAKENGIDVQETILGFDGITIIVNKNNKIKNLDSITLGKIFRGEIKNWKELGGNDSPIIVLSRDSSSGTHEFFKEHIVRENNSKGTQEYGEKTLYMPSNEAIKKEVAKNGIAGYIGMGYMDDSVKAISIDNISASSKNVLDKTYPIARAVYWYSDKNSSPEVQKLISFALSSEGQKIVSTEGFVPLK